SPVNNASQIESPVIFFQGEQDRVVLPDQTRAMVDVLRQRGVEVKAIYFEDEAHGFRKIENAAEVLRSELTFYQACLSRSA
ncbi:MAG: S9 family peptidase, partial [Oceanospirillaceae bacterium]|nr:S9 family peptidase [Oceanospirillaceae bacterium]